MAMPQFDYTVHDLNRMANEPEPPTIEVEFHRIEEDDNAVKDRQTAPSDGRRGAREIQYRHPERRR